MLKVRFNIVKEEVNGEFVVFVGDFFEVLEKNVGMVLDW